MHIEHISYNKKPQKNKHLTIVKAKFKEGFDES